MKEARFTYKCRSCGHVYAGSTCCEVNVADAALLLNEPKGRLKDLAAPRRDIHRCRTNHAGLADVVGYIIVGSE